MLRDRRVFITGGLGFIGSHLIERLLVNNKIMCFDNLYRGSNLDYLKAKYGEQFQQNVKVIKGDVRKKEELTEAIKSFEPNLVLHLAAIAGVRTIIEKPIETISVNLLGSYNLITSLIERSVEKVVYTSTSEVYGPTAYQLSEEENTVQGTPYNPRWSYATSKLFTEHLFATMEREYGIPVSIGRLFNVYGPRQIGEGAIHNFIVRALQNEPLEVYGDGTQIRAWCYINDCLEGLLLITEKGIGIYNIGNPYEGLTTYALALKIKELTRSQSEIVFRPASSYTDVAIRVPNIGKIQKLDYTPTTSLHEGIQNTIKWYRNTG